MRGVQQQAKSPPLSAKLMHPRSAHTATVLPDGTVLILGGVGADGFPVSAAEIFDPISAEITVVTDTGLKPRSHHAATLLTNGYVLITGGISREGKKLQDAERWNPDTQYAEPIAHAMMAPRSDHTAALLPSGQGLIWGGREVSGEQLPKAEIYDPATARFDDLNPADDARLPPAYLGDAPPRVEASLPEPDANDVAVTDRIAVRFSKPLQVDGVTNQTVTLVGPAGAVSGKVVAAGSGLLVFFTPNVDLLPAATYTLFLQGLADRQGQAVPWSAFSFTTQSIAAIPTTPIVRANAGNSSSIITHAVAAAAASTAVTVNAAKIKEPKDQKKAPNKEKESAVQDDEFEDWIPGEPHRHGQWRVLGIKNEPRVSKMLAAPAPLQASPKKTALSGRVARLNGRPIEGVRVSADGSSTLTDSQGRFLLTGLAAGARELTVDGSRAISGDQHYATHFIRVEVAAKRTTVLPQPIYLARMNPANATSISSPAASELVITHPDIPGLELHIPKGTVLRTPDGKIVTKLSIIPLPVDRAPFAVPDGFPVYFTVQPAGVFVDNSATGTAAGIRVVYPNYLNAVPGTRVTFWNYNPAGEGWQVYGQGTVSEDGKQVVPDPDVVQRNLMAFGYGLENTGNAPADGPPPGGNCTAGDPVDCATGLFLHQVTDLFVTDTIPIGVTRTYRQNDTISRDFGIGTNHNYGMFLSNPTGAAIPSTIDVVLPDGGRLRFQKMSGSSLADIVFQHSSTPTSWQGATLRMNVPADRWQITTRDKTIYEFSDHAPNTLVGIRDRYGNAITIVRSGTGGKISQVISPNGRYLNFSYDGANRIIQISDNIGRIVRYEYDPQGRLQKVTDPDNKFEQYAYDSAHRMTTVTDKRGNTMATNVYDSNGRVVQQTLADGAIWQFSYTLNAAGRVRVSTVTNPRGYVKQVTFNDSGYFTQVIHALGQPEQQTYTFTREAGTNLKISTTDPLNRVTKFAYDYAGSITSVTQLFGTADAVTTSYTYEPAFGNLASYTDPLSHQTQLEYDAAGNLVSVADPLSHVSSAAYDSQGQLIAVTNALGKTTRVDYEQGDVSAVTDPLNRTLSFFTDAVGRTTGVMDPMGHRSRTDYDPLDRVLRSVDASGGVTTMIYDANGNVRAVRDARDLASHEFTYDPRNRTKTYTDPVGKSETYNYDGMGNITSKIDRKNQATSYTYDALDRLKTVTYADGSTITVIWDAVNRPRQFIDSVNGTITHDYDGLDRLTREVSLQGQVDYVYDAAGRREQLTIAGRGPVTYGYDAANRLTQIAQGSTIAALTYDAVNRRDTVTLPNGIVGTYGFDDADQLLSIVYDKGATHIGDVAYTYDLAGRRVGHTGSLAKLLMPATVSAAVYDLANRLTNWAGSSLGYDDNGNLTSSGSTTYGWNARNELVSTSNGASSFAYDVFDRRSSRTVAGAATSYLHDGMNPALVNNDLMLDGLGLDEIYARITSTGTTSYVSDALGSTRLLTDASGNSTASYSYAPYGEASKTGSDDTSFQFTGRENDGASGLYYYRARYFSPEFNRFVSEDSIGLMGGMNTYAYAWGNPISYTDPLGLRPLTPTEKCKLKPYIPQVDLDNADLHDGQVPWYLGKDFAGITRGNDIYFRPGVYDATTATGPGILGHELVHVGQYRNGMNWLTYLYSTRHGYLKSPYEQAAYALENTIVNDLTNNPGGGSCGCQQ
jgi:RHS repeat-associated protein